MIRPFVAIQEDLETSAPNLLSSTMKGILVGTAIQDENSFKETLNVSNKNGSISSILKEIAISPKTIITAGIANGAVLNIDTLSFGSNNAVGVIDFGSKEYTLTIPDTAKPYILKIDSGDNKVNKDDLFNVGAQNGDNVVISFTDTDSNNVVENHKIRYFKEDGSDLYVYLWNGIDDSSIDTTTSFSIEEHKQFEGAKLNILAPLSVKAYSTSISAYILDNTENSTDGGFSTEYYIYIPLNLTESFSEVVVSTSKLYFSDKKEIVKTIRIIDGDLYNFFLSNRADLSNNVFEVSTNNYINILGAPTKKNSLSYAMSLIAKEVPGATMKVYVTESDKDSSYIKALNSLVTQEDVYSVTPLTSSESVISAAINMVESASKDITAKFKMAVVSPIIPYYLEEINTDGYKIESIENDLYKITLTNGGFLSRKINIGDFVFNDSGLKTSKDTYYKKRNETYTENAIAAVENIITDREAIVRVLISGTNLSSKFSNSKVHIGRINKNDNLIKSIKERSESIDKKNVVSVFPDKYGIIVDEKEEIIEGYNTAAILNAVMAHIPPQQGLSNLSLNSIYRTYGGSFNFSDNELDSIAEGGNLVIIQQNLSSSPYILRQTTTNTTSLEKMEINKVRCLDYAAIEFGKSLQGFVGKRNVNQNNLFDIEGVLTSTGKEIIRNSKNDILGSIITFFSIVTITIPNDEKDAIDIDMDVETPTSLNKIRLFISSKR